MEIFDTWNPLTLAIYGVAALGLGGLVGYLIVTVMDDDD